MAYRNNKFVKPDETHISPFLVFIVSTCGGYDSDAGNNFDIGLPPQDKIKFGSKSSSKGTIYG